MAFLRRKDHDRDMRKSETRVYQDGQGKAYTVQDLWAEVQKLRARVEELEEENFQLRRKRSETERYLQNQIRKLEKDVNDRDKKIEKLDKQIAWLRQQQFGSKSEKARPEPTEAQDEDIAKAEAKTGKRKRGQQPGSKGHGRTDRSEVPISEAVPLGIPGGCKCSECGKPYIELSSTEDSLMTEMSLMLFQVLYQRRKYVSQCSCQGKKIKTAPPPPKLYPRSTIGNSLWVYLVVQKFLHGIPTNRTLKDLSLYGLSLAEGTVVGGMRVINDLIDKLYKEVLTRCRGADIWNADETTWRVFDAGQTKWWLWLIASDDAVAYILDPSRSKKVPSEFFAGSKGTLMTDRLASYKSLQESIRKAWCWVHVRRDFRNVLPMPKCQKWAKWWLEEIAILFVLTEKRYRLWEKNKTLGRTWDTAQTEIENQIERLKWRWQAELNKPGLHDEQKKILRSLKKHWAGLTIFVQDPRVPLHNNRAERLLRNAVILRKNSFGSGSQWSGGSAAKLFSIFQTWLINGLDPQALLLDYFEECSKTPGNPPTDMTNFLPWTMSSERKQALALPKSYRQPG